MRYRIWALLAVTLILALPATTRASDGFETAFEHWRSDRIARLKGPEGWLNLAGLYWLGEGANSFGAAASNDLVAPKGTAPEKLGEFLVDAGAITFQAAPGAAVLHDGKPVTRLRVADDQEDYPTVLTHGTLSWTVIRRMDRLGVRLRDYNHPALSAFPGIESYPAEPNWRFEARFVAYPEPRQIRVATVVSGLGWEPTVPGTLEFEFQGQPLSLEAYRSDEGLFIVFADGTSGDTTYPAGRYLYAEQPRSRQHHDPRLQQGLQPALRLQRVRHLPPRHTAQPPAGGRRSWRDVHPEASVSLIFTKAAADCQISDDVQPVRRLGTSYTAGGRLRTSRPGRAPVTSSFSSTTSPAQMVAS